MGVTSEITTIEEAKRHFELHTVWVDEEQKIASFHAEEGYIKTDFTSHDAFMIALHAMQLCGFRFQ